MSKSLYEEAIADAKKLREVAVANARNEVLKSVEPRIRQLIERAVLGEALEDEDTVEQQDDENILLDDEVSDAAGDVNLANVGQAQQAATPSFQGAVSLPDSNGDVTLNLRELQDEVENTGEVDDDEEIEVTAETIKYLSPLLASYKSSNKKLELEVYKLCESVRILMKSRPENTSDPEYLSILNGVFSKLNNTYSYIQENLRNKERKLFENKLEDCYKDLLTIKEFRQMAKRNLEEAALTIKVDGFGDEQLNLDELDVTLESDSDEEDEDLDMTADDDMGGDEGGDLDFGSEEEPQLEGLSDDTVLELDENMLRKEISRMRRMAESAVPTKDFGGADGDEGDVFLDGEVTTEGEDEDDAVLEGLEAALEQMDEARKAKAKAKAKDKAKKFGKKVQKEVVSNTSSKLAEQNAVINQLRKELTENNLFSTKLLYVNKLLQNENLTPRQRAVAMERIDEARSLREIKLVFESVTKTVATAKSNLSESRVVGSSSRPTTRSGASDRGLIMESDDAKRWAVLAGIEKK